MSEDSHYHMGGIDVVNPWLFWWIFGVDFVGFLHIVGYWHRLGRQQNWLIVVWWRFDYIN